MFTFKTSSHPRQRRQRAANLVACTGSAAVFTAVLFMLAERAVWAIGGTPPQVFCGATYTFAAAADLNLVANQNGQIQVNTYHHLNLIEFPPGACNALPATVTIHASFGAGPLAQSTSFGPFGLAEGGIELLLPFDVFASPAGTYQLNLISEVSLNNGSIISQTSSQNVYLIENVTGDPITPRYDVQVSGDNTVLAHPGDGGAHTVTIVNNDPSESLSGTLCIRSDQKGTMPTVIAGPNNASTGVFAAADPGGGDDFPLEFELAVPAGACVPHPTQPHLDTHQEICKTITIPPGGAHNETYKTRSANLSADGSCCEYSIEFNGSFSGGDPAQGCAKAIFAADTAQTPQFGCPGDTGRTAQPFHSSGTVGPAVGFHGDSSRSNTETYDLNFTIDFNNIQMFANGAPLSGSNFTQTTHMDHAQGRGAVDFSFLSPQPGPNDIIDVSFHIVTEPAFSTPNPITPVLNNIHVNVPNSLVDTAPFGVIDVDVHSPTFRISKFHALHQVSAVGVLDDGNFTPVQYNNYGFFIQQIGTNRYRVDTRWQNPNPGPFNLVGFDVFNDFRGIALQDGPPPDCNENGQDDAADVSTGNAADGNNDGVPDECQAEIELVQLSLVGPGGAVSAPLTNLGELSVRTHQPPADVFAPDAPFFVNAVINGVWKVQNAPITRVNREFELQEYSIPFQWDLAPGNPVGTAQAAISINTQPLAAPPANAPKIFNVPEHKTDPNGDEADDDLPPTGYEPGDGEDYVNAANETYRIKKRLGVPSVSEPKNHCVPGGVARSLLWMNDLYCLGFPADCLDPQDVMSTLADGAHMMTSVASGTKHANQLTGMTQFFMEKAVQSKLKVEHISVHEGETPTPDQLCKALCEGKDAMFSVGWFNDGVNRNGGHYMTAIGVAIGETTGAKHFAFKDDALGGDKQGDGKKDEGVSVIQFKPLAGNRFEMVGSGIGTNKLERVVLICPRPFVMVEAMGKYLGDAAGDFNDTDVTGFLPSFDERHSTFEKICRALEISEFLRERIVNQFPGETDLIDCITALQFDLISLKFNAHSYNESPDPFFAGFLRDFIDGTLLPKLGELADRFDCNLNGIDDSYDLEVGTSHDINFNGIPDECDCPGDIPNVSPGQVGILDLLNVLGNWGACPEPCPGTPCPGDVNFDCVVDIVDLLIVLANWGPCP